MESKRSTDLKVSRNARLLLVPGLQFGQVVGQVDVHLLVRARATLVVGHPQVNHVVRGRRAGDVAVVVVVTASTCAANVVVGGHVLLLLLDDMPAVHVLLDLGRYERAQPLGLGRWDKLDATGDGAAALSLARVDAAASAAVLLHHVVAGMLQMLLMVQVLLLLLQAQLVRGRVQQRMMIVTAVMLERRLLQVLVSAGDDELAEVVVSQVPEVLVLVTVRAHVLVAVRRFSRVPVLVRHLAAVLVVVHHFARVDQRYALAGQLVRVHVVHVLRHLFGHHDDDPVVSRRNEQNAYHGYVQLYKNYIFFYIFTVYIALIYYT